jgi:hypothetical protein
MLAIRNLGVMILAVGVIHAGPSKTTDWREAPMLVPSGLGHEGRWATPELIIYGSWRSDGRPYVVDVARFGRLRPMDRLDLKTATHELSFPTKDLGGSEFPNWGGPLAIAYSDSEGGRYWRSYFSYVNTECFVFYLDDLKNRTHSPENMIDQGMQPGELRTPPIIKVRELGKWEIEYRIEKASDKIDVWYSGDKDYEWHQWWENVKEAPSKGRVKMNRKFIRGSKEMAVIFEVYKGMVLYVKTYVVGKGFAEDWAHYSTLLWPNRKLP